MTVQSLEITRSSASMWGTKTGIRQKPVVSKYIDTTTCIGWTYLRSIFCPPSRTKGSGRKRW